MIPAMLRQNGNSTATYVYTDPIEKRIAEAVTEERFYYVDDLIEITDCFVRIQETTYSVAHIHAVRVSRVQANRLVGGVIGAVMFAPLGLVGALIVMPVSSYSQVTLILVAGLGALFGLIVGVAGQKDRYAVQVRMASGDSGLVVSPSIEYVRRLERLLLQTIADFYTR